MQNSILACYVANNIKGARIKTEGCGKADVVLGGFFLI